MEQQISVGTPYVEKQAVTATLVKHCRAKKIKIVKFKRRKHYKKSQGHRQDLSLIEITSVGAVKSAATKPTTKSNTTATASKPVTKSTSKEKTTDS